MLGCAWCSAAMITMPMMPSNKLTANESSVPMKVTSRTRTGIAYKRGGRGVGGMLQGYHPVRQPSKVKDSGQECPLHTSGSTRALVYKRVIMSQAAPAITRSPADVVRMTPVSQAAHGVCYAVAGEVSISSFDLERMIAAVPMKIAAGLKRKAYYFVPLTVSQGEEILIADRYDVALSDNAVCHRNLNLGDSQCVFISTRLMDDKFSVAFEFYINVGHALVEIAGVSAEF